MIVDLEKWNSWVEANKDPYGKACINVAREVMKILDEMEDFDCHKIIDRADGNVKAGGITGFMAGCVAQMVSQCHSRGDEFRKKWNEYYGVKDTTKKGVVNPAIVTIGIKAKE